MLKGWRYLGNFKGVYLYQQNKHYAGVILKFSSIEPSTPSFIAAPIDIRAEIDLISNIIPIPGAPETIEAVIELIEKVLQGPSAPLTIRAEIDLIQRVISYPSAPEYINAEFFLIEKIVNIPFAPQSVTAIINVENKEADIIYTPYTIYTIFRPYTKTSYATYVPDNVYLYYNIGIPTFNYRIFTPESITVLFDVISKPRPIPFVGSSYSVSMIFINTIVERPLAYSPDRITALLTEIETQEKIEEFSDYPIVDSEYEVDLSDKGTKNDAF